MPLTREQAQRIIGYVQKDPTSRSRIKSYVSYLVPNEWGMAGSMRNAGLVLGYTVNKVLGVSDEDNPFDASKPENANIVCTGISDAAVNAILGAMKRSDDTEISSVSTVSRVLNGTHHTAVKVSMQSGGTYLFDWHANLEVGDPMIYPSLVAFQGGIQGVPFSRFSDFK